ncbi:MAG TPA: hypothetical protein VIN35_11560, partial [Hydrogenophaga sp.]
MTTSSNVNVGVGSVAVSIVMVSPVIALHQRHPIHPVVNRSRTLAGTTLPIDDAMEHPRIKR